MPDTWRIDGTSEGVVVHGEVDLDTASEFEAQASEAVMLSTAGTFLIDLSDVTFLDSAGLHALIRVLEIRVLELRDGQRIIVQAIPAGVHAVAPSRADERRAAQRLGTRAGTGLRVSQRRGNLSHRWVPTNPSGSSL
jgi:anti-anti-sigma factor